MNLVDLFLAYEIFFKNIFKILIYQLNATDMFSDQVMFCYFCTIKFFFSNLACSQMSLNDVFLLKLHFIKRTNLEGGKRKEQKERTKDQKRDCINLGKHFCGSSRLWLHHKIDSKKNKKQKTLRHWLT